VRPLLDSDVKPMGDMERQGTGSISWIWLDSRADNSCTENERVQDCECTFVGLTRISLYVWIGVRLEWCKARARAHRWSEEVELLLEEMRRVIVFLKWQADWWKERETLRMVDSVPTQEGLTAYACRQSALRGSLIASFQNLWSGVPALVFDGVMESREADAPTID
jgi:hypothetical protein